MLMSHHLSSSSLFSILSRVVRCTLRRGRLISFTHFSSCFSLTKRSLPRRRQRREEWVAHMAARRGEALSWAALQNLVRFRKPDFVKGTRFADLSIRIATSNAEFAGTAGKTNSHTHLRSFGAPENKIRVTFYRDHHAWCPYCQKVASPLSIPI